MCGRAIFNIYLISAAFLLSGPAAAKPKAPEETPATTTRTITTTLRPERPGRTVYLHFLDGNNRSCTDTYKVEASRVSPRSEQSVTFNGSIRRNCNGKSLGAPVPEEVTFKIQTVSPTRSIATQSVKPTSGSYAFTHVFVKSGLYQVTVVHHIDKVESHTVSFTVYVNQS